ELPPRGGRHDPDPAQLGDDRELGVERRLAEITTSKRLIEHLMECGAEDFTQCPDYRRMVETAAGLSDCVANS
ncbi:hypothetical protein AB0K48_16380, partial [Nonomuraea sp. NPDC055795]